MKLGIPCDPFTCAITNFSLAFDLLVISFSNLIVLCNLGFNGENPFWLLWNLQPEHTLVCVLWCFLLIKL
ncbi:hypothetical protein Hanom_Chr06g00513411 [Helianthus anomalus]